MGCDQPKPVAATPDREKTCFSLQEPNSACGAQLQKGTSVNYQPPEHLRRKPSLHARALPVPSCQLLCLCTLRLLNAVVTVMLSIVITAIPSLTPPECVGSFLALDPPFDLQNFDLYGNWFDDNSTVTLAQSGNYKGAGDIEEYARFAFSSSPYIAAFGAFRIDSSFVSFDPEKRSCVMMVKIHDRNQLSKMAGNELFESAIMNTVEWRFDDQRVGNLNSYCAPLSRPGPLCGPRCVADAKPAAHTAHRRPEFPCPLLLCAVDARRRQLRLPDDA
eukprot:scaffold21489_cov67-Phaeocystis_antarctica.AAC.4